jgi:hypothetical protein
MYAESNGAATLRRAYLRLALGVAQMVMAVVSATLLIVHGISPLSVGSIAITSILTTTSVLFFGKRRTKSPLASSTPTPRP